jgi:hypothetical protein
MNLGGWENFRESLEASPVIRVAVRDDDSIERLPEPRRVRGDFVCVGIEELTIEGDELRGSFDDLRIDEPAVGGTRVRMDLDSTAFGHDDMALQSEFVLRIRLR